MKKRSCLFQFITCFIISCFIYGCNETSDSPKADNSLVGRISLIDGYKVQEAEASYDGKILKSETLEYFGGISFSHQMDNTVGLWYDSRWNDTFYEISFMNLPVEGIRSSVTFNHTSEMGTVQITKVGVNGESNVVKYSSVNMTVSGWIKEKTTRSIGEYSKEPKTRYSPARPDFDCEINISCNLDEKKLNFKITQINS